MLARIQNYIISENHTILFPFKLLFSHTKSTFHRMNDKMYQDFKHRFRVFKISFEIICVYMCEFDVIPLLLLRFNGSFK